LSGRSAYSVGVRLAAVLPFLFVSSVAGCRLESSGTATDLTLDDADDRDTLSIDTAIEPDTAFDSVAQETELPDADADAVSDVAPDVPVVGSLALATLATPTFPLDLSKEGTRSWAHWGFLAADSFTRKAGTDEVARGTAASTARYDSFPITFNWNDGDPTAISAGTKTGIYRNSIGTITFDARATADERTLRVYLATQSMTGSLEASFADSSVTPVKVALPVPGTLPAATHQPQVVILTYRASSPTRLLVKIEQASGSGALSLFAVTVR